MSTKAQILVTGGGGYVGSHCVLELLNAGYDVIANYNFVAFLDPCYIYFNYNSVNAVVDPCYIYFMIRVQELTSKKCCFHYVDLLNNQAIMDST